MTICSAILSDDELMPWLSFEDRDWGTSWTGRFLVRDVRPFGRDDDGPELIEEIDQELFWRSERVRRARGLSSVSPPSLSIMTVTDPFTIASAASLVGARPGSLDRA